MVIPRSLGTHSGTFHADEVTASALLLLFDFVDPEKIIRTRDQEKLSQCEYVCDVGGEYNPDEKRFDHHQASYQGELSSAGMIWLYFKKQRIVDEDLYQHFNRALIYGVDSHDNGKGDTETGICTFSHVISNFVPTKYDATPQEQDAAFFEAVKFTYGHLKRLLDRYHYVHQCKQKVLDAMAANKYYLYFEEAIPWMDAFFENDGEKHPALFVIMPSANHWKLRGIPPKSDDRMKVRVPLPEEWGGMLEDDLKRISKLPGALFCHKGRFISVWETKEDAMRALKEVLAREGL